MKYENFANVNVTKINDSGKTKIFNLPIFLKLKSGTGKFSDLILELFKTETVNRENISLLIDIRMKDEHKRLRITICSDNIQLAWILNRIDVEGIKFNYNYSTCEEDIIYNVKSDKTVNNKKFNEIVFGLLDKEITSIEFIERHWDDNRKNQPAIFKTIFCDLECNNQYLLNLETMGNINFISILKNKILITIPQKQKFFINKK